eukprot:gb/GECG01007980.1/.p1 GENE.gb/GECG01007980.1/~~gb/GECG01007980.1/.p1  ORF type:complete len:749 (+),score=60.17 gb/GECG01007980.1/:1-2247(+)
MIVSFISNAKLFLDLCPNISTGIGTSKHSRISGWSSAVKHERVIMGVQTRSGSGNGSDSAGASSFRQTVSSRRSTGDCMRASKRQKSVNSTANSSDVSTSERSDVKPRGATSKTQKKTSQSSVSCTKFSLKNTPRRKTEVNIFKTYVRWFQHRPTDTKEEMGYWRKVPPIHLNEAIEAVNQLSWTRGVLEVPALDRLGDYSETDMSHFAGTLKIGRTLLCSLYASVRETEWNNDTVAKLQNLQELHLSCWPQRLVEPFKRLKSLRTLRIAGPADQWFDYRALEHLPMLTRLEIPGEFFPPTKDFNEGLFDNLRYLKDLKIAFSGLRRQRVTDSVLQKMCELTALELLGVDNSALTPQGFCNLQSLRYLKINSRLGNPTTITLTDECLRHLPNLTELDLSDYTLNGLTPNGFRYVPRLQKLYLLGCTEGENFGKAFKHVSRLRELDMSYCRSIVSSTSFDCLSALTSLNIAGLGKLHPGQLLSSLPNSLVSLNASGLLLLAKEGQDAGISRLSNLTSLNLENSVGPFLKENRVPLDKLVSLNAIGSRGVLSDGVFQFLSKLTRLELHIDIVGSMWVTDNGFSQLENLKHLGIQVTTSSVTDRLFEHLGGLTSLTLDLRPTGVPFSHDPIISDLAFSHLPNLKKLDLFDCEPHNITEDIFRYLTNLTSLKLSRCHLEIADPLADAALRVPLKEFEHESHSDSYSMEYEDDYSMDYGSSLSSMRFDSFDSDPALDWDWDLDEEEEDEDGSV